MRKVAVECRTSTIIGRAFSLSAFLRLMRPLRKIAAAGSIGLIEMTSEELLADTSGDLDALFVSKPVSLANLRVVEKAKSSGARVVVDIDDWMYGFPRYGENLMTESGVQNLTDVLAMADAMTVPTSFLGQVMRPQFAGPIFTVPPGFDFASVDSSVAPDKAAPNRIIASTMFALKLSSRLSDFARALQMFLARHPQWQIDFYAENLADEAFAHERINLLPPVPFEDYLELLRSRRYAFAVVPLAGYEDEDDIVFNACKSPLKYIDYGANGIPGVYSRSPVFETVIVDGATGLLVDNTAQDWLNAMSRMALDAGLRGDIAMRSRADVRERFNLESSVSAIRRVIECIDS